MSPPARKRTRPNQPATAPKSKAGESQRGERLQKVLAAAGVGSRRECEELVAEGRVEVDRRVVVELGTRVDPARQEIRVDGVELPKPRLVYYVLNKPTGVICTNSDPSGRLRAVDLIDCDQRLFTVGRLDRSSEGLIILTNDGELANRLTHPRYGVSKKYAVRVAGHPTGPQLGQLRQGVHLAEGMARVSSIRIKRRQKQSTDLEVELNEGRNREIRRLLARIGHKVIGLKRISMGSLRLGDLPTGAYRKLTWAEVRDLERDASSARRRQADSGPQPDRKRKPRRDSENSGRNESSATTAKKSNKRAKSEHAGTKNVNKSASTGRGKSAGRSSGVKGKSKKNTRK